MKMLGLILLGFCFTFVGCDRNVDQPKNPQSIAEADTTSMQNTTNKTFNTTDKTFTSDNTLNQSGTPEDLRITQNIKKAIVADNSLSADAQNIKVFTVNGKVTVKGFVGTNKEKEFILRTVKNADGVVSVDDQITVKSSY